MTNYPMQSYLKTNLLILSLFTAFTTAACGGSQAPRPTTDGAAATVAQLCVVRHAEAYKNLNPLPASLSPEELDSLTEHGESQAIALRADLPANVGAVWSSPTNRTQQTAGLLGLDLEVVVDGDLRSLHGSMPWDDRVAAWAAGDDPRPDDGENLADGAERARDLVQRLRDAVQPGASAVVVTHGDISTVIVGELRGTPLLDRPTVDAVATGEMVCIDW